MWNLRHPRNTYRSIVLGVIALVLAVIIIASLFRGDAISFSLGGSGSGASDFASRFKTKRAVENAKELFIQNKKFFDSSNDYAYGNVKLFQTLVGSGLVDRYNSSSSCFSYLDWMGSALFTKQQLMSSMAALSHTQYGNPHSANIPSSSSSRMIESMRDKVLELFNVDSLKYTLVFTSGATGALKLAGELFPWKEGKGNFDYLDVNHNSVIGIRELAKLRGVSFRSHSSSDIPAALCRISGDFPRLFAYPAEDNFAGVLYPLDWIKEIEDCGWNVLLDAAGFTPTQALDLSIVSPSYVAISFYKMFGFPTGLGALLIRDDVIKENRKVYFGGGTVQVCDPDSDYTVFRPCSALKLEDGTVSFLSIAALDAGIEQLRQIGGAGAVRKHVRGLRRWLRDELAALQHSNGQPVIEIYERVNERGFEMGGVVAFNVLKPSGDYIGHYKVQSAASMAGFAIRTGSHCNPGACKVYNGLSSEDIRELPVDMDSCMEQPDVIEGKNKAYGAVRVSLGYLSTFEELWSFVEFFKQTYVDKI